MKPSVKIGLGILAGLVIGEIIRQEYAKVDESVKKLANVAGNFSVKTTWADHYMVGPDNKPMKFELLGFEDFPSAREYVTRTVETHSGRIVRIEIFDKKGELVWSS